MVEVPPTGQNIQRMTTDAQHGHGDLVSALSLAVLAASQIASTPRRPKPRILSVLDEHGVWHDAPHEDDDRHPALRRQREDQDRARVEAERLAFYHRLRGAQRLGHYPY